MKAGKFNSHPIGSLRKNAPYKRGKPSTKALNRPVDFRRLRVLALRDGEGDAMILTVALSASDAILAGIAVTDALTVASCGVGAVITRPTIVHDGETALVASVQAPPAGIKIGATVDISAVFRLADQYDVPAVEAVVSTIRVRRGPTGPAKITLPHIGAFERLITVDLPEDPVAQHKAEAAIRTATDRTIHTEVPDDAVALISPTDTLDETDRAIYRELRRLEAMPLPKWMRPDEKLRQRIMRFVNGPSTKPRCTGITLTKILDRFSEMPESQVRALLDEAVSRGEILALKRSNSMRGVCASSVGLYAPKPAVAAA